MTEAEMRALRRQGASYRTIGRMAGMTGPAIFYRLGGERKRRKPANDNARHDVVKRAMPFNGGCSTTSGVQDISLPRVTFIDGAYNATSHAA